MRLLLPYFQYCEFLTSKSKGRTVEFALDVKIVFMKLGFSSVNTSIASVLILLIFIDSFKPFLSRKVL